MARRRSSRRSSRSRGFGRGNTGSLIDGALGGAAARLAAGYVGPTWGPTVGLAAVGMWRRNTTLQTLAGVAAGSQLAGSINLPGATAGAGSGGFI